ncbi:RNA recognition motif containing protein [Babesia ovata]|uniref:RNA recognition motif containing protein n=1 Tax=Babesia ovata TaxID=189622 RepID=A0A2H6KGI2_9APIC|nr:RNA recognition motif containing protein [Babesia ovata]GBE62110.1 RNA recognition motif containing protein [Babesia ovata]
MDNTEVSNEVKEAGIAMGDEVAHGGPNEEVVVPQTDAPELQVPEGSNTDPIEPPTLEAVTPQSAPEEIDADPIEQPTLEAVTPQSAPEEIDADPIEQPTLEAVTPQSAPEEIDADPMEPTASEVVIPQSEPEVVAEGKADSISPSTNRTGITEDDRAKLRDLVDMIVSFGKKVTESRGEDDDEEEGAVQEDEVPFERITQTVPYSNVVHLLNLPPEIDMGVLVTTVCDMTDIVLHCYALKATELKIVFVNELIARDARKLLDARRLHNRVIQAVLCIPDGMDPLQPPHGTLAPHVDDLAVPPGTSKMKQPLKLRGGPPMPLVPPVFKMPPLLPRLGRSVPPVSLSRRGPPPPMPLLPPARFPDGPERMLVPPVGSAPSADPPSKIVFGRNLDKMEGMSLFDMLVSQPQVCNWSPDQSVEEQQRDYDELYAEFGTSNRYLLLGNVPDSATRSIREALEWLSRFTYRKPHIEVCRLEQYAADLRLPSDKFLHLTFQRRGDCTEFFSEVTNKAPDVVCRFACPRTALDTIWVGNVTDMLSYCRDEEDMRELFGRLGEVKACTFNPEKACFFVTYVHVEDAIRARNRLLGALFSPVKTFALNVDFTLDVNARFSHRGKQPLPSPHGLPVEDLSQKLGERLLTALQRRSDGDEVIRQLLDGRDGDAVDLLRKGGHRGYPDRPYDSRPTRLPPPRHPATHGQEPWARTRKRPYQSPERTREQYKYRKSGPSPGEYSPVEYGNRSPRGRYPRNQRARTPEDRSVDDHSTDEHSETSPNRPKSARSRVCDLLKRGKPICKVSALFVRGDFSHRIPETLDVNQRANPERLANYLQKSPELSLWQMGADSTEDRARYDGLCDYLLSKNRVAIVQEGPYEIYIVPPTEESALAPHLPDTQFMYAFVLPKGS